MKSSHHKTSLRWVLILIFILSILIVDNFASDIPYSKIDLVQYLLLPSHEFLINNGNQTFFESRWTKQLNYWRGIKYFGWFLNVLYIGYISFFITPMSHLFLYGPRWYYLSIGWQGIDACDICQELTGVTSQHWTKNEDNMNRCLQLIESRFYSQVVLVQFLLYCIVIFFIVKLVYRIVINNCVISKRPCQQ